MSAVYLGFIAAAIAVGAALFVAGWRRAGQQVSWRFAAFIAIAAAAALMGARLYALAEQGWRWQLDGGLRLPGGMIGMLLGLGAGHALLLRDMPLGLIGDVGAVAAQFALAAVRLGCLAEGCCFGTVSELPWAIRFPPGTQAAAVHAVLGLTGSAAEPSLPVHPLQLYFLLLHLAVALALLWLTPRKAYDGQVLLVSLVLAQSGKALLESLRQPLPGAPAAHLQMASALLAVAAAAVLAVMAVRSGGYTSTVTPRQKAT